MEQFLKEMLQKGWRLRWCKGTFAGFEKTDRTNLRYIVDPYAVCSPMNLKRFPRYRLEEYMKNGWYAIGKSKGCYIFCTDDDSVAAPDLESDLGVKVRAACRISSLIISIVLLAGLFKCFTTPAIIYSILLTDVYIVLSAAISFLILYHVVNAAILLAPPRANMNSRGCIRYAVHDGVLFLLLLSAILIEAGKQWEMLVYLLLPILVVIIGTIILRLASKKTADAQQSNRRLIPIVCIMGILLLILIPFSINRLQSHSKLAAQQRQQELVHASQSLPVIHLSDVTDADNTLMRNNAKENNSILGRNLLYTEQSLNEQSQELSVFTNRSSMVHAALAKPIFHYLYIQAQRDFNEAFQQKQYEGIVYYKLETANAYLLQQENMVYFCTVSEKTDDAKVLSLLKFFME